jgi:tripartite-type tricarboxylate transporter receptor subunit TctC
MRSMVWLCMSAAVAASTNAFAAQGVYPDRPIRLVVPYPPDGYTMLMGSTGTLATAQALYPKLGFDPLKDFAYTSLVSSATPT